MQFVRPYHEDERTTSQYTTNNTIPISCTCTRTNTKYNYTINIYYYLYILYAIAHVVHDVLYSFARCILFCIYFQLQLLLLLLHQFWGGKMGNMKSTQWICSALYWCILSLCMCMCCVYFSCNNMKIAYTYEGRKKKCKMKNEKKIFKKKSSRIILCRKCGCNTTSVGQDKRVMKVILASLYMHFI